MGYGRAFGAVAVMALALAGVGCAGDPEPVGAGGTAGAAGTTGGSGPQAGASGTGSPQHGGSMPCEVSTVVQKHCHTCHGSNLIGGAPQALITLADFHQDYVANTTAQLKGKTYKMYELARIRLNAEMGTGRMPQNSVLDAGEMTMLNTWLMNGAPEGVGCAAPDTGGVGGAAGTGVPLGGMGGAGGVGGGTGGTGTVIPGGPPMIEDQCERPGAFEPLTPNSPEEKCYDFRVHGQSGVGDTSKFTMPGGESYNQFYYAVPWGPGMVSTRFGQDFDNDDVLHHWLAFAQGFSLFSDGDVEPNVLGTTLLTDAELIAGWAVGGCTTTYPENVGVAVPSSGIIMIQWHHYNKDPIPAQDGSAVQICVVPEAMREHKAGLTFLGTENISVPGGSMGTGAGTCYNDSQGPITIIGFTPHMHEIGIHMKSEVTRMDGTIENVFDKPFQFDYQTNYMMNPPVVMMPGESITSTCTWENKAATSVGFGQSTKSEMCYQFALSYPYRELNNGVGSLIGATNTCW